MAVYNEREAGIQEIDAALQKWCQGDYVLGEQWFIQFIGLLQGKNFGKLIVRVKQEFVQPGER